MELQKCYYWWKLTANGTTTTLNTTNSVSDRLIELGNGTTVLLNDMGIVMERGDSNAFMGDESADKFIVVTEHLQELQQAT